MWLRQLLSSDASARSSALNNLWGSICHQGWICPATGYAAPYLIELLEYPDTPDKDKILVLLADIVAAGPLDDEVWRHNQRVPVWNVPEHIAFNDAHAAVLAGMPIYCALLSGENVATRIGAATVLARCIDRANEVRAYLSDALQTEQEPTARGNLLLTLRHVTPDSTESRAFFADALRMATSEIERFCAALSLMRLAQHETPEAAVDVVFSVFVQPSETLKAQCRQMPSEMGLLRRFPDIEAHAALYALGPARLKFALPTVHLKIAAEVNGYTAFTLSRLLLFILFGGEPPKNPPSRPASALTLEQRAGLEELLSRADLWATYSFISLLKAYGLPSKRADLEKYLGKPLPMDQATS